MDGTSVTIPMYTYKYIKNEHVHQNQVKFSNEVTQINAEDMPLVVSLVTASLRHVLFFPNGTTAGDCLPEFHRNAHSVHCKI